MTTPHPIRVVIGDDIEVFADVLRMFLDEEPSIEVVGVAHDGLEAVDLALRLDADVAILDERMPVLRGVEAATRLRDTRPEVRVIIVSADDGDSLPGRASAAGAVSFLRKDNLHETISAAIRAAVNCA